MASSKPRRADLVKTDMDFFTEFSKGSGKTKSILPIIALILIAWIILMAVVLGILSISTSAANSSINRLQREMGSETYQQSLQQHDLLKFDIDLLNQYLYDINVLFSRIQTDEPRADAERILLLQACLPADAVLQKIEYEMGSLRFGGISMSHYDPLDMIAMLEEHNKFTSITINGIEQIDMVSKFKEFGTENLDDFYRYTFDIVASTQSDYTVNVSYLIKDTNEPIVQMVPLTFPLGEDYKIEGISPLVVVDTSYDLVGVTIDNRELVAESLARAIQEDRLTGTSATNIKIVLLYTPTTTTAGGDAT